MTQQDKYDKIRKLVSDGQSYQKAADAVGISYNSLNKWKRQNGLTRPRSLGTSKKSRPKNRIQISDLPVIQPKKIVLVLGDLHQVTEFIRSYT